MARPSRPTTTTTDPNLVSNLGNYWSTPSISDTFEGAGRATRTRGLRHAQKDHAAPTATTITTTAAAAAAATTTTTNQPKGPLKRKRGEAEEENVMFAANGPAIKKQKQASAEHSAGDPPALSTASITAGTAKRTRGARKALGSRQSSPASPAPPPVTAAAADTTPGGPPDDSASLTSTRSSPSPSVAEATNFYFNCIFRDLKAKGGQRLQPFPRGLEGGVDDWWAEECVRYLVSIGNHYGKENGEKNDADEEEGGMREEEGNRGSGDDEWGDWDDEAEGWEREESDEELTPVPVSTECKGKGRAV